MKTLDVRADQLAPASRCQIETLLGESLSEEERVHITVYAPHPAPTGASRDAAADGLCAYFERLDKKIKHLPDEEAEAIIQEAIDSVRHPRR